MAKRQCPYLSPKFVDPNTNPVIITEWLVGTGDYNVAATWQYQLNVDFAYKWEKYDPSDFSTTIVYQATSIFNPNELELNIWNPCLDVAGLPTPCPLANWKQTNATLTDPTIGGYFGDGSYTFTAERIDGCVTNISRNIILGCMESTNPNYDPNATLDTKDFHSNFTMPANKQCV